MKLFIVGVVNLILCLSYNTLNPYDPGPCDKKTKGTRVVVKDRQHEDKLLVCLKMKWSFQWKMIDGNSYGNYFDPAKGCSDIIDNVPEATDGVYWIKTEKGPRKVWCDVFTDGGGFMLIGVQNSTISWDVPSNPSLVDPLDTRHWSSAFGNKEVMDFRIQIATSKSFADTKAHWYYRFNSPRKLTNLLMFNKGGCSRFYPGIGDVKFIKDLRSNKIVTNQFKCSRFGGHFHKTFGWGKMNECFQKPCQKGFAFLRLSTSGSFSFSVKTSKSGIRNNATALIGCHNGKCCACFGPSSEKDYCDPNCQPINGGTVLKNNDKVNAWFWIRKTLPKRVWRKCMEYEKKTEGGGVEKWHVEEDRGVPKKGSCSYPGGVRLNDGIAVVRNNQTLNHLPNIEGLLSYRSDNRKLYFRGKTHWKTLASEKQVRNNEQLLKSLQSELEKRKRNEESLFKEVQKLKSENEIYTSCQSARNKNRTTNGSYRIKDINTRTYCHMTSLPGCSGGGWTLAMKINGRKDTFHYYSSYWSNKQSYNPAAGLSGLDDQETKLPIYWSSSFKELCVGMKVGNRFQFVSINHPATSLYSLIADGRYRATHIGRHNWLSLPSTSGALLQPHCNREGFNAFRSSPYFQVRLGIIANQENDCNSPDSFVGFGGLQASQRGVCGSPKIVNSCGNSAYCVPGRGNKEIIAMGYIFIR